MLGEFGRHHGGQAAVVDVDDEGDRPERVGCSCEGREVPDRLVDVELGRHRTATLGFVAAKWFHQGTPGQIMARAFWS
jgi:hypothetical protein